MTKIWMSLGCFVLILGLTVAQNNNNNDYDDYDAWFKNYDDHWDQEELGKLANNNELKSKEDIAEEKPIPYDKDYQIEDNREFTTEELDDDDDYTDYDFKQEPLGSEEEKIMKETADLIKKTDSKMEVSNEIVDENKKDTNINKIQDENKDFSLQKVSNESDDKTNSKTESIDDDIINKDLLDLIESIRKLNAENPDDTNEVLDYEDKFSRPFHEGVILQQRQYSADDIDEGVSSEDEKINENSNVENKEQNSDNKIDIEVEDNNTLNGSKSTVSSNIDDKIVEDQKTLPEEGKTYSYGEDGIDATKEESNADKDVESITKLDINKDSGIDTNEVTDKSKTSLPLKNLIETKNEDIVSTNNNAPVKIPINYIENIPIMSPKYPDSYPNVDMIYDYILEGDGLGIELNVTEVNINGGANDFLFIIPGGVDETSAGGLLFSYNVDEERLFRFTEVDRLFVRFRTHETNQPPADLRWTFSVRLLGPRPLPPKPAPEPEPESPKPQHTYTVYFGGVTPQDFKDIRSDFKEILVDMAMTYVAEYNVYPRDNSISVSVNISRVAVCNINWPDFDNCAAVSFSIILQNKEHGEYHLTGQDLYTMWTVYSQQEDFANRLSALGLTAFSKPNDGWALTLWLTIGMVCLMVAAGLAYGVWRWSCFEDYTKMPEFSETDSSYSQKKHEVGLYPTPYQDLPALYSSPYDADTRRDSTRVDMDGYSNKGFVNDPHLFGLDYSGDDKKSARSDLNSSRMFSQPPFYSPEK